METTWTIREPASESDYQRAIDEMLKEMDRIDERIVRKQQQIARTGAWIDTMLSELKAK